MSKNTVNQSHFSKMCGVSRQAVSKAVKAKLIKLIGKKVNLDHRITCEYYFTQTGKSLKPESVDEPPHVKSTPPKKAPPVKKTKVEKITAPVIEDGPLGGDVLDIDNDIVLPDGIQCLDDINEKNILSIQSDYLKKLAELEKAKTSKQKREEALGLLIKRTTVRTVFAKLHTIDTNQWKTLEDRISPGISGIFGFEEGCPEEVEVRKIITNETSKTLRHVKRLLDEFLIKNKEAPLE